MHNIKNIAIAGATGMVGVGIVKHILGSDSSIQIRASYHTIAPIITHERVNYIKGDFAKLDDCKALLKGCDCVVLAAAHAGGARFTTSFPWEHAKENLMMNMHLLEAALKENIKRIIFIGSATLYPEFEGKIKESELDLNQDPHDAYYGYGWVMRFIEKLCVFLHKKFDREVIIVRAANIFGPYSKFDPNFSNFIPAIIRKAVDKMDPFELWGSSDIQRDVLHVDDFARAIDMIIREPKISFDVFNIGSGHKTTVGDVVTWALQFAKHTPSKITYSDNKPKTIKLRALDCSKIQNAIGWKPNVSTKEGVKLTTEWWLENKNTWKK